MLGVFLLTAFARPGHECQHLLSPCDEIYVCTDYTSVYTLIRKNFGGMESEPMLTPREKFPLPEKFSSEEDRTRDAASNRTASPTHCQRAIPAPSYFNSTATTSVLQTPVWTKSVAVGNCAWWTRDSGPGAFVSPSACHLSQGTTDIR